MRDPSVRRTTKGGLEQDPGVLDKRLFIQEGEFASVLKVFEREGNTLSAILRNAWDHGNLATLIKNSPDRATNAHISINAHITEEELLKYLTKTELANGLANRFLWFRIRRSKLLPFGSSSSENIEPFVKKLVQIQKFASIPGPITLDGAAREIWSVEYERLTQPRKGMYGGITARSEALVIRLALIYALCECSDAITPIHLRAALAVWDYADWSCRSLFGDMTGDKVADAILSALQSKSEGLTRTQISHDLFKKNKSAEEIERALNYLASRKLAFRIIIGTEGKPTEVWKTGPGAGQ